MGNASDAEKLLTLHYCNRYILCQKNCAISVVLCFPMVVNTVPTAERLRLCPMMKSIGKPL